MNTAIIENDPRYDLRNTVPGRPRFFPEELRNKPQLGVHDSEPVWAKSLPANPSNALAEIAEKVFSKEDRSAIQKLENEIGEVAADRALHCNASMLEESEWNLNHQDPALEPEELIARTEAISRERAAIPQWRAALDRHESQLKERLRPYALKLAVELPGKVAKAVNDAEAISGPQGVLAYWNLARNFDPMLMINPLRRLHALALDWVQSLQTNDSEAQESRIRAILEDSGALKPKVAVFRKQF